VKVVSSDLVGVNAMQNNKESWMIRYHLAALALKGFSSSGPARKLYRGLGNRIGGSRREKGEMPAYYLRRVQQNVAFCRKYSPLQAGDLVVELGTGWVHWEALTLRLFFDFEAVLYDVWDNRQFSAMKSWLRQLECRFGEKDFLEGCDFDRARWLIHKIDDATSFDDVYSLLGFQYVVDPGGLMQNLPRDAFRLAISRGVMEHIPAETAPQFVLNMASLVAGGGLGIHGINISDHLSKYDPSASPKQYLRYSDSQWRFWYENGVQYINRIQRSAWLQMFANAGFSVIEESREDGKVTGLRVHAQFQGLSWEDIACTTLLLVVRKGPSS
jgi:hypothetical protein